MRAWLCSANIAALILAGSAHAQEAAAPSALPGWMAGCWMAEGEGNRTEECWTVPRGSMMLGSSHMFNGAATLWFEHMRIVHDEAGLAFIAQPRGAPPSRFAAVAAPTGADGAPQGIMFADVAHDYPQRVHYWLAADGALIGEISRMDGSRAQRWVYRRP